MTYIVVTGYDKRSGLLHTVAVNSATGEAVVDYGYVTSDQVVTFVRQGGVALNFSVNPAGELVQDSGVFTRFSKAGSAVVTAEVKNRLGRTVGYRLLSCANNGMAVLKLEDILAREKNMPSRDHFLQNAIVHSNFISCYAGKKFPIVTIEGTSKEAPVANAARVPSFSPKNILDGTCVDSPNSIPDSRYKAVLESLFKYANAEVSRGSSDGVLSKAMYHRLANMVNWLLKFKDDGKKVDSIIRMCDKVPIMARLLLEDSFCKRCPNLDRFIDQNAMKIIQATSRNAEMKQAPNAMQILGGQANTVMSKEQFDSTMSELIRVLSEMISANGGKISKDMYKPCGNLITWVVTQPEQLSVSGIKRIRDELPDVTMLLFDEVFCKQYCPSSDKFFDDQAVKFGMGHSHAVHDMAMDILAGRVTKPQAGMPNDMYDKLLSQLILFVQKRIVVDSNSITPKLSGHIGHMLTWVTQVPETKRAVSSMCRIRDEIPLIGKLILDADFCREFPSVDAFFEANADALTASSSST